jgi:hypothetical protein
LVSDDRQVTLRLPEDVPPGEHHVVLLISESPPETDGEATPTRRERELLVYDGELALPLRSAISELREERLQKFFPKAP